MSHGFLLAFRTLVTVLLFESTPLLTFRATLTQGVNSRVGLQPKRAWPSALPVEIFSTERRTETHGQDDVLTRTPAITYSAHSGMKSPNKIFTM